MVRFRPPISGAAGAWAVVAAAAVVALSVNVAAFRGVGRPLIDRRDCLAEPSPHTLALDRSPRGDALYRFVYDTLFGLGKVPPRPGFAHLGVAPVCTVGWKDPVAALMVGTRIFLVTFKGAHVDTMRPAD